MLQNNRGTPAYLDNNNPSEIVPSYGDLEDQENRDVLNDDEYDSELQEFEQDAVRAIGRRSQDFINIDAVSLSETPRSERIKNALANPTIVSNINEERS